MTQQRAAAGFLSIHLAGDVCNWKGSLFRIDERYAGGRSGRQIWGSRRNRVLFQGQVVAALPPRMANLLPANYL